ncbi:MAG: hypothetical protein B7Y39_19690 [Bdellovibrio sp. 28-41-41]|nr:MAG: hypothetical protein B7Y39_19690 [Bdellovibrio sp. 28-41-41]
MTIDQLETLEMVVEKGSFKAASEHLHKTQPSLSVAIKKLEEEFDLKLFSREEYRPKLTPEGVVFYNWAKQCLFSFRELRTVGLELGTKKVEPFLNIILDPLVRLEVFCDIFDDIISGKYPTEITFRSEIMSGGVESLLTGEANFAISVKAAENEAIESIAFDKIEMIPVVAKAISKKLPSLTFKSLKQIPQIIVQQQPDKNNMVSRDSRGVVADTKRCYVSDHSLKHKMISNGFGWGRLAQHEVASELKKEILVAIRDENIKPFVLDLHIMRLKHKPMGPVAQVIWDQLSRSGSSKSRSKSK